MTRERDMAQVATTRERDMAQGAMTRERDMAQVAMTQERTHMSLMTSGPFGKRFLLSFALGLLFRSSCKR
jgi:hypothetical protein